MSSSSVLAPIFAQTTEPQSGPGLYGLRTRVVSTQEGLASLDSAWNRLSEDGQPGAPFRALPWLSTWWSHFGTASRRLHVLVAEDADGVVGILPLFLERRWRQGAWQLRMLGSGAVGSDYLGLLGPRGTHAALARALAVPLGEALQEAAVDLLELTDLDAFGAFSAALAQALRDRFIVKTRRPRTCPFAAAQPDFDAYLDQRPDGAGDQFRRRLRWLARRSGFDFEVLETRAAIRAAFDDFLRLHHARWTPEENDGISTPALEAFHRDAAIRMAERGQARLYFLRADGERRAALYGLADKSSFVFYQSGHDPAWRQRSVGTVLLGLVLKDCFARGLELDFGHGEEAYKRLWATGSRQTHCLRVVRSAALERWLSALEAGRHLAGRVLRAAFARGQA